MTLCHISFQVIDLSLLKCNIVLILVLHVSNDCPIPIGPVHVIHMSCMVLCALTFHNLRGLRSECNELVSSINLNAAFGWTREKCSYTNMQSICNIGLHWYDNMMDDKRLSDLMDVGGIICTHIICCYIFQIMLLLHLSPWKLHRYLDNWWKMFFYTNMQSIAILDCIDMIIWWTIRGYLI